MADRFGSSFTTIVDEDGTEYELEILMDFEYNGNLYYAVTLAGSEDDNYDVDILKVVEEDGEEILCAIEDMDELEEVNAVMIQLLYENED